MERLEYRAQPDRVSTGGHRRLSGGELGRLIKKMRLKVDGMEITVSGWRDRKEPQLREITYKVRIVTDEPEKKILRVKELAEKYGTVFNTVGSEKIKGKVEIIRPR